MTFVLLDDHYEVPLHVHRPGERFIEGLEVPAIHSFPRGLDIRAYIRAGEGDVLRVIFHGALNPGDRHPRFDRITSSTRRGVPFISFSDPSMGLPVPSVVERQDTRLGWFVGTRDHDLPEDLADIIRRVMSAMGLGAALLAGSSGGGFAALNISSRLPGSTAVVFNPQTNILTYKMAPMMSPRAVNAFLASAYGGITIERARQLHLGRLSMVERYRTGRFDNLVHYVQNVNDLHHLQDHFRPFAEATGIGGSGQSADGRRKVTFYEGKPGHFPPTQAQFDLHVDAALRAGDSPRL